MSKLQFRRKADFGQFCMMLCENRIPFSLAGFLVIILLDRISIEELPDEVKKFFKKLRAEGRAGTYPFKGAKRLTGQRPTKEESIKLLRKFSKRLNKNK